MTAAAACRLWPWRAAPGAVSLKAAPAEFEPAGAAVSTFSGLGGLIALGYLAALPVVIWLMGRWLEGFAYRTAIGIGPFVAAGLAVLAAGWLSVGFQSVRAARANPTDALRYE